MVLERSAARTAAARVWPPEPAPTVVSHDQIDSFDDDLAWIIARYVERTGASDGVLSIHHSDGQPPELLFAHGPRAGDTAFGRRALDASAGAVGHVRRGAGSILDDNWSRIVDGDAPLSMLSIPLASDAHAQVVLSTIHSGEAPVDAGRVQAAAARLQPVLVGYFKLWLLNRAQRRRIDGLASALNFTDIAILLLDGEGKLLFTNHAARGLLDDLDGIRRVGPTVTATDMADAVKLRVAIEHVIGLNRDEGDNASPHAPIVPLRRRDDRRALIASVLPAERPPQSRDDPTAILYVFSPDINVGLLLAPICQIYGLSPAETRLVGLLAEGLSVTEAAGRMRVKVPTLRTYLKQIFVKTETVRQSDLIRLMMGSLIRTRPGVLHTIM